MYARLDNADITSMLWRKASMRPSTYAAVIKKKQ